MKNFCVKVSSSDRKNDFSATMTHDGQIKLFVKHHGESVLAAEIDFHQVTDGSLNISVQSLESVGINAKTIMTKYQPKGVK